MSKLNDEATQVLGYMLEIINEATINVTGASAMNVAQVITAGAIIHNRMEAGELMLVEVAEDSDLALVEVEEPEDGVPF